MRRLIVMRLRVEITTREAAQPSDPRIEEARQELSCADGSDPGHGLTGARGSPRPPVALRWAAGCAPGPRPTATGRSPRIRQCTLTTTTCVRVHDDSTQAAHRHADLPGHPGEQLLLRRQDRLHRAAPRRGQALLPVAPAALRQEPVPGHLQGAVRGQRAAVRGARHPRPVGLVGAASRAAPQLR